MPEVSSVRALSLVSTLALAVSIAACDSGSSYDELMNEGGTPPSTGGTGMSAVGGGGSGTPATPTPVTPAPATVLPTLFGTPMQVGQGNTSDRWNKADVKRNDVNYFFMANGWGPKFESQTVSWLGTSFSVDAMEGKRGDGYEPASYPTVFCGVYSDSRSGACGLPKAVSALASLRTGWRWNAGGNAGQYNAAYDIWLSTSADISGHSSFLMVWLRDPPGQQPAGQKRVNNIAVTNAPGFWNIWVGVVGGKPCISYVRAEGQDSPELEIDAMDFIRDAAARAIDLPGSTVLSVAVGFEIWAGPVAGLKSEDFYVQAQ
ncbi:MAG: putative glycine-rich protein [Polyangiaceae bacterium]|jgi:hypothetical protein|nr:putative glycine-rich protein [Polyangiaceae bacterium]